MAWEVVENSRIIVGVGYLAWSSFGGPHLIHIFFTSPLTVPPDTISAGSIYSQVLRAAD